MLGVYSGFTEEQLDNFSFKFYKGCIKELVIKLNFDGIKSIMGNAYAKDATKIIQEYNPFSVDNKSQNGQMHRMTKEEALAFIGRQK